MLLAAATSRDDAGVLAERSRRSTMWEQLLDAGGMRRIWLRGRQNVQKRYLIQVAAYNLGLVMRALLGAGTPRAAAAAAGLSPVVG